MGKIIVFTNLTLDGVMQAPGRADEDPRGGFEHGGWAAPFGAMQQSGDSLANTGALLFGRHTYESFYAFFPNQTDNPFTAFLNEIPKYVVSTTLDEPPPWSNSTLISGDIPGRLEKLKGELDKDLAVFGSGILVQSLMRWSLVDEYVLLIHPLVLGTGRRLFVDNGTPADLRLRDVRPTTSGVVIATYSPAES
ncbi:MAG TPA: dihydrofolate reductase family protein [Blastocatellia bacterium]|nr:dihydrofolate reductase family protein [Blastocatellia bacterium]